MAVKPAGEPAEAKLCGEPLLNSQGANVCRRAKLKSCAESCTGEQPRVGALAKVQRPGGLLRCTVGGDGGAMSCAAG